MRSLRACLATGLVVGLVLFVAACGRDSFTQPSATSPSAPPPPPSIARGASFSRDNVSGNSSAPPAIKVTFTIRPYDDNVVLIGPHALVIPANSVCNPLTSGYGIGTWNLPCSTITSSVTVTATASIVNGHPLVEFDTHLRFKPVTAYGKGVVMLYLFDPLAAQTSKIDWCAVSSTVCVDESTPLLGSPELKTWYDFKSFWVYRKIQHFSGYNVTGSRDGGDQTDPNAGM
jgi:hypothetical protein